MSNPQKHPRAVQFIILDEQWFALKQLAVEKDMSLGMMAKKILLRYLKENKEKDIDFDLDLN
jgi:hypothetical protein